MLGRLIGGCAVVLSLCLLASCPESRFDLESRNTLFRLSDSLYAPCLIPSESPSIICAGRPTKPPSIHHLASLGRRHLSIEEILIFSKPSFDFRQRLLWQLEKRVEKQPQNFLGGNDLGVVRWYFAEQLRLPAFVPKALADLNAAWSEAPRSPIALFNRATWLSLLGLEDEARLTWQSYLAVERDPDWRGEGEEALRQLGSRARAELRQELESAFLAADDEPLELDALRSEPATFRQELREISQGALVRHWIRAEPSERERTRRLVAALEQSGASPLLADSLDILEEITGSKAARYETAHQLYADGVEALDRGDLKNGHILLLQASKELASGGSPFRLWAEFQLSILGYYEGTFDAVYLRLEQLLPAVPNKYPALLGRCHWIMALCKGKQGDLLASLGHLEESLNRFRLAGEVGNQAAVLSLLAEVSQDLGQTQSAWEFRLQALAHLREVPSWDRKHNILYEVAETLRRDEAALALPFLNQMVVWAAELEDPIYETEALSWRAKALFQLGQDGQAEEDLVRAGLLVSYLPESGLKHRVLADVKWILGNNQRRTAENRLQHLETAEALYRKSGDRVRLPELFSLRAEIHHQQGNPEQAIEDLVKGIRIFEGSREDLPRRELRISYFDRARGLFDQLIPALLDEGRTAEAWNYSERSKARVLKDLMNTGRAPSLEEVLAEIPERSAVLEFVSLEEELVLWVLRSSGERFFRLPLAEVNLAHLSAELTRQFESGHRTEVKVALKELGAVFEVLIRPAEEALRGADTWIVVPDKDLYRIPFDSLRQDNRFIFESTEVVVVPSASLWLKARQARDRASSPPRNLLAVGVGVFPPSLHLTPLHMAEAEAKSVSELYPEAWTLLGEEATRDTFNTYLARADVLHLATHAAVNPEFPLFSYLAFGFAGQSASPVYAHELYELAVPNLKVAVLAACSTGSGLISHTEGPHSLARPFLAQGVPNVLASLWNIEDDASADFLLSFHRNLAGGIPPAAALRQAKMSFLGIFGQESVQQIVAFQMLGAD